MALQEPGSQTTVDGITGRPVYGYTPPAWFFDPPTGTAPSGPGVFNVMDYGAVAGASFNSAPAIQAAINAAHTAGGGVVYIPAGTFGIAGDPVDPSEGGVRLLDNVFLKGEGMQLDGTGGTVLRVVDNYNFTLTGIVRSPAGEITKNFGVADVTLDGNRANNPTGKVDAFFCGVEPSNPRADEDVWVLRTEAREASGYGFDPHEVTLRLTIQDSVSHHNHLDGFTLDYQVDGVFKGNLAYANDRHGFNVVTTTNDSLFENNIARDNGAAGIYVQRGSTLIESPHNLIIRGGEISGNGSEGIRLWASDNVLITGVDIHHNGVEGIRLSGASKVTITGNNIHDNSVDLSGQASDVSISDAYVKHVDPLTGLDVYTHYKATNNLVTGNTISDTDAIKEKFGVTEKVTAPPVGATAVPGGIDHNVIIGNTIAGQLRGDVSIIGANSFKSGQLGTAAGDTLTGGDTNDYLSAGDGDDRLVGGAGNDQLWGGAGADTFVARAGMGADAIGDWQRGADKLDLSAFSALQDLDDVLAVATEIGGDTAITVGASDTITLSGVAISSLAAAQFVFAPPPPPPVTGTAATEIVTGTAAAEVISALAGDDTISGGAGNDTITGGDGADIFIAGAGMGADRILDWQTGADRIDLGAFAAITSITDVNARSSQVGGDTVIDLGGGDTIALAGLAVGNLRASQFIFAGPAPINGTAGADTINGTVAAEIISGLDGDDIIDGKAGDDTLTGGNGADRFVAIAGMGADRITDWQTGADTLDLRAFATLRTLADVTARATQAGADTLIDLGGGNSVTLAGVTATSLTAAQFVLTPPPTPTIDGTTGADTINGTTAAEIISGLDGNDVIDGKAGHDTLIGGNGADRFVASTGMGADRITDWQTGADTLDLRAFATLRTLTDVTARADQIGADTVIDLGGGNSFTLADVTVDSLTAAQFVLTPASTGGGGGGSAAPGTLTVAGTQHAYAGTTAFDTIDFSGVSGGVTINEAAGTAASSRGIDTFTGIEAIVGSASGDVMIGGGGNSRLSAGGGNDVLTGGDGLDVLTGGAGHDTFRWQYLDVRNSFEQGVDRITDFAIGQDTIDLSTRWGGRCYVSLHDTAEGTLVRLNAASASRDVALLENVHGLSIDAMIASGSLIL